MEIEHLRIDPLYENRLDMHSFACMLDSTTQSYKFYWLEAILTLLVQKDEMSFEEIIYEMFWEAWYTVTQYHLHLGPVIEGKSENCIEHALHVIEQDPDVRLPMTKEQFFRLADHNNIRIEQDIEGLIKNVPYRLLSSFMSDIGGGDRIWDQKKRLIAYLELLNEKVYLPYTILDGRGAAKRIHINEAWKHVLLDNYSVIKSWIQMKKVRFLQDRNPGVPGVIYKLEDEENKQRKLERVRQLWLSYEAVSGRQIQDMYSKDPLQDKQLSIDHFIPWSYVANDELWNLVPMDKSRNASKGNRLPEWNHFFPDLMRTQYDLYQMIFLNQIVREKFEECKAQNLNALWAIECLYVPGKSQEEFGNILDHNMKPVYEAAILQGYGIWNNSRVCAEG